MDPYFRIETLSATPNPQQVIYAALHQDYAEEFVFDELGWKEQNDFLQPYIINPIADDPDAVLSEEDCGRIAVKRLLAGGRGHYGCYSQDTEVLTDAGWKLWSDLAPNQKLLAVDIKTGESWFEKPSALQILDAEDLLYSVKGTYVDLLVTQDHRMVASHRKKSGSFSEWDFQSAASVLGKPVRYLLNACLKQESRKAPDDLPEGIDPTTAFKIAGFFFGDGMRTRNKQPECLRFRIRRPRKIAYLLSLGLPVASREGDRYVIYHAGLAQWVHQYFSSATAKAVPEWLLTLPMELIAAFWDGLKNSDGTRVEEKSWAYDSSDKKALDIIQATAHINGFSANMTLNNKNEGPGHENHRPCWRIHISERQTYRVEICHKGRSPGASEELVHYKGKVYCATVSSGALLVRRNNKVVVSGNCIEHPQIVLNAGWFPHSTMQQLRTHRCGISFDVQSGRYTGQRVIEAVEGKRNIEEVFYLRPVGDYTDRQGKKYHYSADDREGDIIWCKTAADYYRQKIKSGYSEEHARGILPYEIRQHFVVSMNLRTAFHLLDLRHTTAAQLEAKQFCELLLPQLKAWCPDVVQWYEETRLGRPKLAP